ncbi:DEAD-box ATP-dependent RNA helicase CshA-like [Eupeodes corollae]|uniref:DEAD-box ATP-dependent RNA helicase CshA-like n=1 Tax=Eupeodes corollae TaxID=290404 RepID=UPI002491375D|nr:DEAD-box ATP-dependent RNA helicase CshA-like [Eupeodes corollae]
MESVAHNIDAKERTDDVRLKNVSPFSKMLLADPIRKGLEAAGFVYPTVIQAAAIPIGKSGMDLLVQSKSGTGKTLIFCTIILDAYQTEIREPQSLVLVPTREIAVQIEYVLNQIGKYCHGFRAISVIGGMVVTEDRKNLQGAKAIVGTPGRVLHLIQNEILNTSKIRLLVIDEADKMYSQSFRQDLAVIRQFLPSRKQTVACSATFCNDLDKELAKMMKNPLLVSTENRATLLVGIKQFVYEIPEQKTSILEMNRKLDALRKIFGMIPFKQCLLFTGSQSRAESYKNCLEREGWPCELISGAQDQKTRLEMFKKFREFKTRIMVCTDLMARGIDSENANLVINLELPTDVVTYLHRIGRAGRFGSHGIAISFVASDKDRELFTNIRDKIGTGMNILRFPELDIDRDFWDFTNFDRDFAQYGCFGDPEVRWGADEGGDKENVVDNNFTHSIDTKTFQVELREAAMGLLELVPQKPEHLHKLTPESKQSSSQKLPSSNTIDDASSIAADSDILRSSQQDIQQAAPKPIQSVLCEKVSIPNITDFLVDRREKKKIDPFEEYKKVLDSSRTESVEDVMRSPQKLMDIKNLLINSKEPARIKKDIYSDYENFNEESPSVSQATCADVDIDKATFILSVATPSALDASSQDLNTSQQCDVTEDPDPEVKHFPSPANINPPQAIPIVPIPAPPADRSPTLSERSNSVYSDDTERGSSGFDENIISGGTSGIVTSGMDDESSYGDESASYFTDYDDDDERYNWNYQDDNEFNIGSPYYEEEEELEEEESEGDDTENYDEGATREYQQAYHRWVNMYWNQMTLVRDYVNFSSFVRGTG